MSRPAPRDTLLVFLRSKVRELERDLGSHRDANATLRLMLAGGNRNPAFRGRCRLCGEPAAQSYCYGHGWAATSEYDRERTQSLAGGGALSPKEAV